MNGTLPDSIELSVVLCHEGSASSHEAIVGQRQLQCCD